MDPENWIKELGRYDLKLSEIVMPGSHDAGVWEKAFTSTFAFATAKNTVCQHGCIFDQAVAGSRIFDCRVFITDTKAKGAAAETKDLLRLGHFAKENKKKGTGSIGGYGGTLYTLLHEARRFVRKHPDEFIILRISHTYGHALTRDAINSYVHDGAEGWMAKAVHEHRFFRRKDKPNLATCTLGDLRGTVVVCCEQDYFGKYDDDWNMPFSKYDGETDAGLITCGVYKSKKGMKDVHGNAEKGLAAHAGHDPSDHLLWIYWQQTGGSIKANTTKAPKGEKEAEGFDFKDRGAHANLHPFCEEIADKVASGKWHQPNVISHDFVTAETCGEIIKLNKHLIKAREKGKGKSKSKNKGKEEV